MKRNLRIFSGLAALVLSAAAFHQAAFADNSATGPIAGSTNAPAASKANVVGKPAMVYTQLKSQNTVFGGNDYGPVVRSTPDPVNTVPANPVPVTPTPTHRNPNEVVIGVVDPGTPAGASSGAPYTTPSGNYPGTGSSPQPVTPPPVADTPPVIARH